MLENSSCPHVAEQKFTFVGDHAFCFAVEEFAVELCAVAEDD